MPDYTKDDRVTVPLMPHLGVGIVKLAVGGRCLVAFEAGGLYETDFDVAELEPAKPLARTA